MQEDLHRLERKFLPDAAALLHVFFFSKKTHKKKTKKQPRSDTGRLPRHEKKQRKQNKTKKTTKPQQTVAKSLRGGDCEMSD